MKRRWTLVALLAATPAGCGGSHDGVSREARVRDASDLAEAYERNLPRDGHDERALRVLSLALLYGETARAGPEGLSAIQALAVHDPHGLRRKFDESKSILERARIAAELNLSSELEGLRRRHNLQRSSDPAIRREFARSCRNPATLVSMVRDDTDPSVRHTAMRSLARLPADASAVKLSKQILSDAASTPLAQAALSVLKRGDKTLFEWSAERLLHAGANPLSVDAARLLGRSEWLRRRLLQSASEPNAPVRSQILVALTYLNEPGPWTLPDDVVRTWPGQQQLLWAVLVSAHDKARGEGLLRAMVEVPSPGVDWVPAAVELWRRTGDFELEKRLDEVIRSGGQGARTALAALVNRGRLDAVWRGLRRDERTFRIQIARMWLDCAAKKAN